jgi:hypothetical protein
MVTSSLAPSPALIVLAREWVWQICSAQGGASDDSSSVGSEDDTVSSILDKNGDPIWNSATDAVRFA